jgi:outer membrane receptor for ferrienterochelin and colicin
LKDFISSQIAPDIKPTSMMSKGVRQMTNIDNAYKAGIEGSIQWNITNYLRTEAGAAYTYAQNMSQDVPLSEIAPLETDCDWKEISTTSLWVQKCVIPGNKTEQILYWRIRNQRFYIIQS